jgi:hypothetical protein
MASPGMIYIPNFMKIGEGFQNIYGGKAYADTDISQYTQ